MFAKNPESLNSLKAHTYLKIISSYLSPAAAPLDVITWQTKDFFYFILIKVLYRCVLRKEKVSLFLFHLHSVCVVHYKHLRAVFVEFKAH